MSAPFAKERGGVAKRRNELMMARRREGGRARRNAQESKALKMVPWNVNCFAPRALDFGTLFAHEGMDVLFVCEKKLQHWYIGAVKTL